MGLKSLLTGEKEDKPRVPFDEGIAFIERNGYEVQKDDFPMSDHRSHEFNNTGDPHYCDFTDLKAELITEGSKRPRTVISGVYHLQARLGSKGPDDIWKPANPSHYKFSIEGGELTLEKYQGWASRW